MTQAFYIGQSHVVGGTTTDIVAYVTGDVFVQIWIGAEDKLPRMARADFRKDPLGLRHQVDYSNWKLGGAVPAGQSMKDGAPPVMEAAPALTVGRRAALDLHPSGAASGGGGLAAGEFNPDFSATLDVPAFLRRQS